MLQPNPSQRDDWISCPANGEHPIIPPTAAAPPPPLSSAGVGSTPERVNYVSLPIPLWFWPYVPCSIFPCCYLEFLLNCHKRRDYAFHIQDQCGILYHGSGILGGSAFRGRWVRWVCKGLFGILGRMLLGPVCHNLWDPPPFFWRGEGILIWGFGIF